MVNAPNYLKHRKILENGVQLIFISKLKNLYAAAYSQDKILYEANLSDWKVIITPEKINPLRPTWLDLLVEDFNLFLNSTSDFRVQDLEKNENEKLIKAQRKNLYEKHQAKQRISSYLHWKAQEIEAKRENAKLFDDLMAEYPNDPYNADLMWQKAKLYINNNNFDFNDTHIRSENQNDYVTAHQISSESLRKYKNSLWNHNNRELIKSIEWQWATFEMEQSPLTNSPIAMKISHRNLSKVLLKFLKRLFRLMTFLWIKSLGTIIIKVLL